MLKKVDGLRNGQVLIISTSFPIRQKCLTCVCVCSTFVEQALEQTREVNLQEILRGAIRRFLRIIIIVAVADTVRQKVKAMESFGCDVDRRRFKWHEASQLFHCAAGMHESKVMQITSSSRCRDESDVRVCRPMVCQAMVYAQ